MKNRTMILTAVVFMFMTAAHASAVLARAAATVNGFVNGGVAAISGTEKPAVPPVKAEKKKKAIELVRGVILSVDSVKNEIVIVEAGTGKQRVLIVHRGAALLFKKGDRIKAKVFAGTKNVDAIKRLENRKAK